jgi:CBS domain-containing protein
MRPCYGVTDGKPHLRIENRVLPSGPTIEDEVANAAFWIGLMVEGPLVWPDLPDRLEFRDARSNFLRAARDGLSGHMTWFEGEERPMREMCTEVFLPVARAGLTRVGIDPVEVDRTLGVIEARIASRQTGAHWVLASVAKMRGKGTRSQRLASLTRAMLEHQEAGTPVHDWSPAELHDGHGVARSFATVAQCMTTDLFTVGEDECVDLVASIMDWERVRHIPVENASHELVGLVSYRSLLRAFSRLTPGADTSEVAVSELMIRNPVTVSPDTPTIEAIKLMCDHGVACLPVVEDGRLVGIVSERDYTEIARQLLERALREEQDS